MRKSSRVVLAAFLCCSMTAFVNEACSEDPISTTEDAPDGSVAADGNTPSKNDASTSSDASVTTVTCPEACAQTASSAACTGKTYDDEACKSFCPCVVGAFRPELVSGALACIADCRDGGGGEDKCLSDNFAPWIEDPEVKDAVTACSARQAECRDGGTSLGTDVCALYAAKPEFLSTIKGCLPLPCDQARACVQAAYTQAGCGD